MVSSFFLLTSCNPSKSKLVGIYVASNQEYSVDSLYLFENNYYKHSIYLKKDKFHIHTQYGKWSYKQGFIDLDKFYGNDDKMYDKKIDYQFEENYMVTNSPVNSFFSKVSIDINSDMGNIYEKILSNDINQLYLNEFKKLENK
jgi:hypothetical protein